MAINDFGKPEEERPLSESLFEEDDQGVERFAQEWEVKKGRNTLLWAGGLMIFGDSLLLGINGFGIERASWVLGFDFALFLIFLGLAFWTARQPVIALSIALGLYVLLAIFRLGIIGISSDYEVYLDFDNLQFNLGGLLIKGLIIFLLVKALIAARKLEEMNRRDPFFKN